MFVLNTCICDKCGAVYEYNKILNSEKFCIYCLMTDWYKKPSDNDITNICKSKKIMDVILAPAKVQIKEVFNE